MNNASALALFCGVLALFAAGCGNDSRTSTDPVAAQAERIKSAVIYEGERLIEFKQGTEAGIIERVADRVCDRVFWISGVPTAYRGTPDPGRLFVTCEQ